MLGHWAAQSTRAAAPVSSALSWQVSGGHRKCARKHFVVAKLREGTGAEDSVGGCWALNGLERQWVMAVASE